MNLLTIVIGLAVSHAVVWGVVRQMRRDGYTFRRYQLVAFVALEVVVGLMLLQAGWTFFVWLAVNAGFLAVVNRIRPPRRPT